MTTKKVPRLLTGAKTTTRARFCLSPVYHKMRPCTSRRTSRTPWLRGAGGGRSKLRKLTMEQAREIRRRWADGTASQAAMGREYGLSTGAIFALVHNKTYKAE